MADKKVYWDSCVWIGLINQEADKIAACQYVIDQAEAGVIEIWTSAISWAEVFKKKCAGTQTGIPEPADANFESFLSQDYVVIVQVDRDVGLLARKLLRTHAQLAKPNDAIHLATALLNNVDEFHTFDGQNLLALSGVVNKQNGAALQISVPPNPPPPPDPNVGTLFEALDEDQEGAAGAA